MKTDPFPASQSSRSFILRLVVDAHGELHGQISEPGSETEWRATFANLAKLLDLLTSRMGVELEHLVFPLDALPERLFADKASEDSLPITVCIRTRKCTEVNTSQTS